jgi:hypothetical protein
MLLFVVSARIITEKKTKLSGTENKGNRKHNFSDKPCAQRTSTMKRANSLLTIKEYDDICNMEISGQSRVKKLEAEVDRFRQKISEQDTSKKKNARK